MADILYKTFEDGKKTDEAITGIAFALRILPEKNPKLLENFTLTWPGLRKMRKPDLRRTLWMKQRKTRQEKSKAGRQIIKLKNKYMNKINLKTAILPLLLIAITLSSCEAIAGIFKAGVWFGVIGVIVIIVVIFWLISKAGKK